MVVNPNRVLVLLVNTICDISCRYCFYTTGQAHRDSARFESDKASKLGARLRLLGFSTVILSGGDPFARQVKEDSFLTIETLQKSGLKVVINTSGASLNQQDCDEILRLNPARLDFSVDSHIATIHDHQRGRYASTITAIKYLLDHNYRSVVTTTVLSKLNIGEISATVDYLKSLGVAECRVQPVYLPANRNVDRQDLELVLSKDHISRLHQISSAEDQPRSHYHYYLDWFASYFRETANKASDTPPIAPVCQLGKRVFVADASCNLFGCFHRLDVKLGSLLSSDEEYLSSALSSNVLTDQDLPSCVGKHCVSLFDSRDCWGDC